MSTKGTQTAGSALSRYDKGSLTASEQQAVAELKRQWALAQAAGADQQTLDSLHRQAEDIRARHNYSGGAAGNDYIGLAEPAGAAEEEKLLSAWRKAAEEQGGKRVDAAVAAGTEELERALEDAGEQFREQQEQSEREELQQRDNSALYAELRGDKGGIGREQYDAIAAAAARNRQAIRQAQTRLAADTWRQIADLRAQGEFQKADNALSLGQTYLSKLTELKQWASEFGLSQEKLAESIRQWQAEYELEREKQLGGLTGTLSDGSPTYAARTAEEERLAELGYALLKAGVLPSDTQLGAMGMTKRQARAYLAAR